MTKKEREIPCRVTGEDGKVLFSGNLGKLHDAAKWIKSPTGRAALRRRFHPEDSTKEEKP